MRRTVRIMNTEARANQEINDIIVRYLAKYERTPRTRSLFSLLLLDHFFLFP